MYYARQIATGYEFRRGGEKLPDDITLTADEFAALLDERATIENGKVVSL